MKKFFKSFSKDNKRRSSSASKSCNYDIESDPVKFKKLSKLHLAAWKGDIDKVISYAKKNPNVADKSNRTALHFACRQGHEEVVRELLSWKAKTDLVDDDGCSPLMIAVRYNQIGCTTALVEAHASPNCVDYNEETVVHYAARLNLSEHLAAISRGANPASLDTQNKLGETPLWLATASGCTSLARQLLRLGALVNVVDDDDRSPLMISCERDHTDIVSLLLEHGADWKVTDKNGKTVFDYTNPGADCLEVLRNHGATPSKPNRKNQLDDSQSDHRELDTVSYREDSQIASDSDKPNNETLAQTRQAIAKMNLSPSLNSHDIDDPPTGQFDHSITSKARGDSDWGDSTLASDAPLSPRGGADGGGVSGVGVSGGDGTGHAQPTLGQKLKALDASVKSGDDWDDTDEDDMSSDENNQRPSLKIASEEKPNANTSLSDQMKAKMRLMAELGMSDNSDDDDEIDDLSNVIDDDSRLDFSQPQEIPSLEQSIMNNINKSLEKTTGSNDDEWDSSDEDQTDIEEAVAIQNMSQSDRSVAERAKYEPYDSKDIIDQTSLKVNPLSTAIVEPASTSAANVSKGTLEPSIAAAAANTITSDQWDSESELVSDVELSNSLRASASSPPPLAPPPALHLSSCADTGDQQVSAVQVVSNCVDVDDCCSDDDDSDDASTSMIQAMSPHKPVATAAEEPSFSQAVTSTPRRRQLDADEIDDSESDDRFDSEDEMNSADEIKICSKEDFDDTLQDIQIKDDSIDITNFEEKYIKPNVNCKSMSDLCDYLGTNEKILGGNLKKKKKNIVKEFKNETKCETSLADVDVREACKTVIDSCCNDEMKIEKFDNSTSNYAIGDEEGNIDEKPDGIGNSDINNVVNNDKFEPTSIPTASVTPQEIKSNFNPENNILPESEEKRTKTGFISILGKQSMKQNSLTSLLNAPFPPPPPPPPRELAYVPASLRNKRFQLTSSSSCPAFNNPSAAEKQKSIVENLPPFHPELKSTYERRRERCKSTDIEPDSHLELQYPRNTLMRHQNYPRRSQDKTADVIDESSCSSMFDTSTSSISTEASRFSQSPPSSRECSPAKIDNETRLSTFISPHDPRQSMPSENDLLPRTDCNKVIEKNCAVDINQAIISVENHANISKPIEDVVYSNPDPVVKVMDCLKHEPIVQNMQVTSNVSLERKKDDIMFENWRQSSTSPFSDSEHSSKCETIPTEIDDSFNEFLQGGITSARHLDDPTNVDYDGNITPTVQPITSAFIDLHIRDKTITGEHDDKGDSIDDITLTDDTTLTDEDGELDPFFKASNIYNEPMDDSARTTKGDDYEDELILTRIRDVECDKKKAETICLNVCVDAACDNNKSRHDTANAFGDGTRDLNKSETITNNEFGDGDCNKNKSGCVNEGAHSDLTHLNLDKNQHPQTTLSSRIVDNSCGDGPARTVCCEFGPKGKALFKIPEAYKGDNFKTPQIHNSSYFDSTIDYSQSDINSSLVTTHFCPGNIKADCVVFKKSYIVSEKQAKDLQEKTSSLTSISEIEESSEKTKMNEGSHDKDLYKLSENVGTSSTKQSLLTSLNNASLPKAPSEYSNISNHSKHSSAASSFTSNRRRQKVSAYDSSDSDIDHVETNISYSRKKLENKLKNDKDHKTSQEVTNTSTSFVIDTKVLAADNDGLSYSSSDAASLNGDTPLKYSLVDQNDLSRLQIQNRELQRKFDRERTMRITLETQQNILEKDSSDLNRKLKSVMDAKSILEGTKIDLESQIRSLTYSNKRESDEKSGIEVCLEKARDQLSHKDEQITNLSEEIHTLKMSNSKHVIEVDSLNSAIRQAINERDDAVRDLSHEKMARGLQKMHMQKIVDLKTQIHQNDNGDCNSETDNIESMEHLSTAVNGIIENVSNKNSHNNLSESMSKLRDDRENLVNAIERERQQNNHERSMMTLESEEGFRKIEDLKMQINLAKDALTNANVDYNLQLSAAKQDNDSLQASLRSEKTTREKYEIDMKLTNDRLQSVSYDLEKSLNSHAEMQKNKQSEIERLSLEIDKHQRMLSLKSDTINSLNLQLKETETRLIKIENELQISSATIFEKTSQITMLKQDLEAKVTADKLNAETLRTQKDENIRLNIRLESNLEKLNSVQHDNVNLKVALDNLQANTANSTSSADVESIIQRLHNDQDKRDKAADNVALGLREQLRSLQEELSTKNVCEKEQTAQNTDLTKRVAQAEASLAAERQNRDQYMLDKTEYKQTIKELESKLSSSYEKRVAEQAELAMQREKCERIEDTHKHSIQNTMNEHSKAQPGQVFNHSEIFESQKEFAVKIDKINNLYNEEKIKNEKLKRDNENTDKIKRKFRRLTDVKNDFEQKIIDYQESISSQEKEILLLKHQLRAYKKKLKEAQVSPSPVNAISPVNLASTACGLPPQPAGAGAVARGGGVELLAPTASTAAVVNNLNSSSLASSTLNNGCLATAGDSSAFPSLLFNQQQMNSNNCNMSMAQHHQQQQYHVPVNQDSMDSLLSMKENSLFDRETLEKTSQMQNNDKMSQINRFLSERAIAEEENIRKRNQREDEMRHEFEHKTKSLMSQVQTLESRVRQLQMHAEEKEMSSYLQAYHQPLGQNHQHHQPPTTPMGHGVYTPPRYVAPQHNPAYNVLLRKNAWPDANNSNINHGPPVTLDPSLQQALDNTIEKHLPKGILTKKDNRQIHASVYKNLEYIDSLKRDFAA